MGFAGAIQNNRHASVDVCDFGGRFAGDDGEVPVVVKTGEGERLFVRRGNPVFETCSAIAPPLKISRRWNQTTIVQ